MNQQQPERGAVDVDTILNRWRFASKLDRATPAASLAADAWIDVSALATNLAAAEAQRARLEQQRDEARDIAGRIYDQALQALGILASQALCAADRKAVKLALRAVQPPDTLTPPSAAPSGGGD